MTIRSGLLLLFLLSGASATRASQPWDEPFSAATAEIAKAAAAVPVPEKAGIIMLLQEHHWNIQRDGSTDSNYRRVYRITKQSSVEEWAEVEQGWQPWHESKPQLRARVISANGTVHELDPKTIADAPVNQFDSTIFSDDRVVRAPLPAVEEGSVVEYEIVRHETAPLFSAGVVREVTVDGFVPVERFHATIDAAREIPLRVATELVQEFAVKRTETKRGAHVEVDLERRPMNEDFEMLSPPEVPVSPRLRFSTGASWQDVAQEYGRILAEATRSSNPQALFVQMGVDEAKLPKGALQLAIEITSRLHQSVRYTGVEFAQASIVPMKPDEVLKRHYGDCKDKATLLVTLLRSKGLDAHVALLKASTGDDVDAQLAGLGEFNHAIVYVAGDKPIWIDATADAARPGTLPLQDQGRKALIVDDRSTALVATPLSTSADNTISYNIEIHMRENGKANIRIAAEATGSLEESLRSTFGGDGSEAHDALERMVKTGFAAKSLGAFESVKRTDFSQPYHLMAEAVESSAAITDPASGAVAQISKQLVFEHWPLWLRQAAGKREPEKTRTNDWVLRQPYRATAVIKIFPPPGASAKPLGPPEIIKVDDAVYQGERKINPDGSVEIRHFFDTGKRRWKPDQFAKLRKELERIGAASGDVVAFTFKTGDLVALGKTGEALRLAQQDAMTHPENSLAQLRYSGMLSECGAGDSARIWAQKAVDADPKSAKAWMALALAFERDSFGRLRVGNWNSAEAEKALLKAEALDPDDVEYPFERAILLEYDAAGERYAKGARLDEAVALYKNILLKNENTVIRGNLVTALTHAGKYREARDEAAKLAGQPQFDWFNTALAALIDGVDRAIIDSQSAMGDRAKQAQDLLQASVLLDQLRKYEEARALTKAAQRLSGPQARPDPMPHLSKYEDLLAPVDDPKRPVQELLALIAARASPGDKLRLLLSKNADLDEWQRRVAHARKRVAAIREMFQVNLGGGEQMVLDVVVSTNDLNVRGDGNPAYAVDAISHAFQSDLGTVVVVKEEGKCKLLATSDSLGGVGGLVLKLLQQADLHGAQAWLDFVRDKAVALPLDKNDEKGPAFRYLWAGIAAETRNATFARAAAASLLGTYTGKDEAIRVLRGTAEHPVPFMDREDIYFAICEALRQAGKWQQLLDAARPIWASKSYRTAAFRFASEARLQLGLWKDLEKEAESQLDKPAKSQQTVTVRVKTGAPPTPISAADGLSREGAEALGFLAIALVEQGRFDEARKRLDPAKDNLDMGRRRALTTAWIEILGGKVSDQTLTQLQGESQFSRLEDSDEALSTEAVASLMADRLDDCKRALATLLAKEEATGLESSLVWLAQGELLKSYSLGTEARRAFEKAKELNRWGDLEVAKLLLSRELGEVVAR